MTKVYIDGSAGTTGLRIHERLANRSDIELFVLPDEIRKDIKAREQALNEADIAFLCLPDSAAIEAVSLVKNPNTAIIDTSTAHRTSEGWEFGFPELKGRRERIKNSKRVANPGCHASGFIAIVEPLVQEGFICKNINLSCVSLTGYSGGGKKMIAEYEQESRNVLLDAPRMYGLTQQHKHLKEMVKICGLENAPAFCPIVAPYYSGMEVTVTLFKKDLKGTTEELKNIYKNYYTSGLVYYSDESEEGFISANAMSGRDDMAVSVYGNEDRVIVSARFDNLGKGASGSAIQNMNLLIGQDEKTGLIVK